MKYMKIPTVDREVSRIALGCMRIDKMSESQADEYVKTALSCGYNFFDHADIYASGRCEEIFGGVLSRNKSLRDKLVIQTKCGIRQGMYDFSYSHIMASVEASLRRLNTERIDVLLLHRPDLLMEPDEVARAFDELYSSGKVGAFGVSNHSPMQLELLQKSVNQKLCINQLQLSVTNASMISSGASVNTSFDDAVNRDGYVRDYCKLNDITIQPWSPLQYGFFEGTFLDNDKFSQLNRVLDEMAEKYSVSKTAVAIAWLLRLPEKMQPVVGSTDIGRIKGIAKAADVVLEREDWYMIYRAAGHSLP